jgi:hypothetical protein
MQDWQGIVARLDGPFHFRFIVQPSVASILAIIDGVKDARMGKPAYYWALIVDQGDRTELIKDGWKSIFKVFILAMVLEAAYQLKLGHLDYRGYVFVAAFGLQLCRISCCGGRLIDSSKCLRKKG